MIKQILEKQPNCWQDVKQENPGNPDQARDSVSRRIIHLDSGMSFGVLAVEVNPSKGTNNHP